MIQEIQDFYNTFKRLDTLLKLLDSTTMEQKVSKIQNFKLGKQLDNMPLKDIQTLIDLYPMLDNEDSLLRDVLHRLGFVYSKTFNHLKDEIEPYLEVLPKIVNDTISKEELASFIAETEKERIESRKIIQAKVSDFP